jgi:hypothetical protein
VLLLLQLHLQTQLSPKYYTELQVLGKYWNNEEETVEDKASYKDFTNCYLEEAMGSTLCYTFINEDFGTRVSWEDK